MKNNVPNGSTFLAIVTPSLITRAIKSESHKFPSGFFAQDLVSHAATADFYQSLPLIDARDYLGSSH